MDQFPIKRTAVDNLDKRTDINSVMPIIRQVCNFLMTKGIHEMRKQDKYNPTLLGNVNFFLQYNDISKETRLSFDKHPSTWRTKDIIGEMLNIEADMMMEKQGDNDVIDNPFTY